MKKALGKLPRCTSACQSKSRTSVSPFLCSGTCVIEIQQVRRWDDEEYVYRVAWRNRRAWVLEQLALYETEILEMSQVFLLFATDAKGQTPYEHAKANPRLLLGDSKD